MRTGIQEHYMGTGKQLLRTGIQEHYTTKQGSLIRLQAAQKMPTKGVMRTDPAAGFHLPCHADQTKSMMVTINDHHPFHQTSSKPVPLSPPKSFKMVSVRISPHSASASQVLYCTKRLSTTCTIACAGPWALPCSELRGETFELGVSA